MVLKNGVKNIQAAAYKETRTVFGRTEMREYSGSFEDVSSNTVIYFRGIPKEF